MVVGLLRVELLIPANRSLKGKRRILKSLKDRLRNRFNISVAEIDNHDAWQKATVGVSCVATDAKYGHQVLTKVVSLIDADSESDILDYRIEML